MPGPIAHHFTAQAVAQSLIDRGMAPSDILSEHAPFLFFGSQGPDFLFFNTRDWPVEGDLSRGIEFVMEVYGTLREIKQFVMDALPLEEIDAVMEAGRDEFTTISQIVDLVRAAQATSSVAEATIRQGIMAFVAENFGAYLFNEVIGHPEQKVQDRYQQKPNWWWFDTLHYKRTGQFAETLMRNAQSGGRPEEIAYALGYLTHFAADTVGHPYINLLSGGPYRTHSQRHKVIENYHDTFLYRHYMPEGELAQSRLFEKYLLGGSNGHPQMPPNLADLIVRTMHKVYPDHPAPRYGQVPDAANLQGAYHLWFEWFRMATTALEGLRTPQPYRLDDELAAALARFEREMREIEELLSRPMRGGFSILAIFEMLTALALAFFEFFKTLTDFLLGSALTIALTPFRKLLSVAYEALYNMFMTYYEAVALSGLAFPFHNMLRRCTIQHFLNPANPERPDFLGHTAASYAPANFPLKHFLPGGLAVEGHLVYPLTDTAVFQELNRANIGPKEYLSNNPVYYLENAGNTVPDTYAFLRDLNSARLPDLLAANFNANYTLGSARAFSTFLFGEISAGRSIPNFNLDGDRGYGFKSWRLRTGTGEMPGAEDDFPRINQIEENPDRHSPDSLVNIL